MCNTKLQFVSITSFRASTEVYFDKIDLSYQVFGPPIGSAPVVVINHALTGNSNLTGSKNSWLANIVGANKVIDTGQYTVIAFNIPGNGYDDFLQDNYNSINACDVAQLFLAGLAHLNVKELYALIGFSVGGGIAWEMVAQQPLIAQYFIPVAANWKASDWIVANCFLQDEVLKNSENALSTARMLAMLQYRTPASLNNRFKNTNDIKSQEPSVIGWLKHHGCTLEDRFDLKAYQLMNHLLSSVDIENRGESFSSIVLKFKCKIIQVSVNSDLFFTTHENQETAHVLTALNIDNEHAVIDSIHGHDAFLMETVQLITILKNIFTK